ncbi:MAG: CRTAC1 family protein [Planctomycetaceae bacterium]
MRQLVLMGLVTLAVGCSDRSSTTEAKRTPRDEIVPAALSESNFPETAAHFVDVTDRTGIEFVYRNGEEADRFSILESLGGGIALFDYDGDGDLDLLCTGGGGFGPGETVHGRPPALFRNEGDWQFTDVTAEAGLNEARYYSHAAVATDYDNDGFTDVLITGYGGLALYHNGGDGTFTEIAQSAGLDDRSWSVAAAFGDLNGDSHPDLYVAHYVNWSFENDPPCLIGPNGQRDVCPPKQFDPLPDVLFMSNGDGTFRDASAEAGLREDGKGLGAVMADLDLDGDLDIYVANDTVDNFLYLGDGRGRLVERGQQSGVAYNNEGTPDGSMGTDVADFNLDGRPDLWVVNYENESLALYRNEGNALFQHVSQAYGLTLTGGAFVSWGTVFFDADCDADEDVFISNGHVYRAPTHAPLRQTPLLFENHDGERFHNVAPAAGEYTSGPHRGRGAAAGDIDGDGDWDLVVSHVNEPAALLANETEHDGHWLSLDLVGTRSSRDAVGTRVRLRTEGGEQWRQIEGGGSYASTSDRRLFFGLGEAERVEEIEILWPSGTRQVLNDLAADRIVQVVEDPAEN